MDGPCWCLGAWLYGSHLEVCIAIAGNKPPHRPELGVYSVRTVRSFWGRGADPATLQSASRQGLGHGSGNENKLFRNWEHEAILKLASEGAFKGKTSL